ncbi:universal stress protein [Paraburkholderia sp. IW21]|uniref:universal stress protein n=1 Tax=Paraburkholderia sp. IW21 TaxID=3242488 RepID=UPI00351FCBB8
MYKRILVAIDGSETSEHAFDAALQLAYESGAQLQPLYVVDNPLLAYDASGYDPTILRDAFVEEGQRLLADALARMKHENVAGTPRMVDVEPIGEDISERIRITANEFNADLLVLGTHGRRGFKRLFLGSVAERVVRSACCPVLLVPSRQTQTTHVHSAKPGHADVAAAMYEIPPTPSTKP